VSRQSLVSLLCWAPLLLSCGDGGPDGDWVAVGSGPVLLYSHPKVTICPGSAERAGRLTREIADALSVDVPTRLDYFYVPYDPELGSEELRRHCRQPELAIRGCAIYWENRVFASDVLNSHELTHVVANRGLRRVHPLTSEGLAVYFGSLPMVAPLEPFEPSRLLDVEPNEHNAAGVLIGSLLDRFGAARVMEFHRNASMDMTEADFRKLFQRTFGESLEVSTQRLFEAGYQPGVSFPECHGFGPPSPIRRGVPFNRHAQCDEAGVGTADDPKTSELVEVEPGSFRVSVRGGGNANLFSCDSGEFLVSRRHGKGDFSSFGRILDGKYRLETSRGAVSLEFERAALLQKCEPTEPADTSIVPKSHVALQLPRRGPVAVPLRFEEERRLAVSTDSPWKLCDEKCSCELVALDARSVEPGSLYWLLLEDETSVGGWIDLQ